ncbi:hypothetical protein [Thioclava sp. GXIMD4216]|uniref:hypothetical protein n=1 Tax=Thioclava sp. GXIMD4216 TaxID=3131929 RepID=UPI0030D4DF83
MHVERDQVKMGVPQVISSLVMKRGNKARFACGKLLSKCSDQGNTLLRTCFNRKRDDEAFTDAPLALEGSFFGSVRRCRVINPRESFPQDNTCG